MAFWKTVGCRPICSSYRFIMGQVPPPPSLRQNFLFLYSFGKNRAVVLNVQTPKLPLVVILLKYYKTKQIIFWPKTVTRNEMAKFALKHQIFMFPKRGNSTLANLLLSSLKACRGQKERRERAEGGGRGNRETGIERAVKTNIRRF